MHTEQDDGTLNYKQRVTITKLLWDTMTLNKRECLHNFCFVVPMHMYAITHRTLTFTNTYEGRRFTSMATVIDRANIHIKRPLGRLQTITRDASD